jgi:hypothetical protein
MKKIMNFIDRHFGKEILYVVTEKVLLGSQGSREEFGTLPTEKLAVKAFEHLKASLGSGTWPELEKAVLEGRFPYFAWYGDYQGKPVWNLMCRQSLFANRINCRLQLPQQGRRINPPVYTKCNNRLQARFSSTFLHVNRQRQNTGERVAQLLSAV